MKTANKVIDDRIAILDSFLEKTKDDSEPGVQMNRGNATLAKGLFSQLKSAIEEHTTLLNAGVNNEDLTDKIRELVSQTMSPLIERNKQIIDSYKQKKFNLYETCEEIKRRPNFETNAHLKTELSDASATAFEYDKALKDTIDYLQEYEIALSQIKNLIEAEIPITETESEEVEQEEDNSGPETEQQTEKNENGEFPV